MPHFSQTLLVVPGILGAFSLLLFFSDPEFKSTMNWSLAIGWGGATYIMRDEWLVITLICLAGCLAFCYLSAKEWSRRRRKRVAPGVEVDFKGPGENRLQDPAPCGDSLEE